MEARISNEFKDPLMPHPLEGGSGKLEPLKKKDIRHTVANGQATKFWKHPWASEQMQLSMVMKEVPMTSTTHWWRTTGMPTERGNGKNSQTIYPVRPYAKLLRMN